MYFFAAMLMRCVTLSRARMIVSFMPADGHLTIQRIPSRLVPRACTTPRLSSDTSICYRTLSGPTKTQKHLRRFLVTPLLSFITSMIREVHGNAPLELSSSCSNLCYSSRTSGRFGLQAQLRRPFYLTSARLQRTLRKSWILAWPRFRSNSLI